MKLMQTKNSMNLSHKKMIGRAPIHPDRVRRIGNDGFAFVPNRFLRDGFFSSLTPDEFRLYLLLVLAGDRSGLSFYHYDSLCSLLEVTLDDYVEARNGLVHKDLVAYDGTRFQVLALPPTPIPRIVHTEEPEDESTSPDSIAIRYQIRAALARKIPLDR